MTSAEHDSSSTVDRKLIFAVFLVVALGAGICVLAGGPACIHPPWVAVDGYANASVLTWNDINGDGEEEGEISLPWITIQMAYERSITDSGGKGSLLVFKPGCGCRCWKGETVSVQVPIGYAATTPTELDLTGYDRRYTFGLRLKDGSQLVSFPGQPDWFQAFSNRGLRLVAFNYDDTARLDIVVDATGNPGTDEVTRNIVETIVTLRVVHQIEFGEVTITVLPSGQTMLCEMYLVEHTQTVSPAEVLSNYCKLEQTPEP